MRCAVSVCLSIGLLGCDPLEPAPDLERMINQQKAKTYSQSDYFPDGRAMRTPPEHTVTREGVVPRGLLAQGHENGIYALSIPFPLTKTFLERGRTRFNTFCAPCHGMLGDGNSVVAMNMDLRKPPSIIGEDVREFPPGRVFQVITGGYGLMRSYQNDLPLEDRWAVVAYLRALQLSQYAPLSTLPAPLRRAAEKELP